tara:strand:+ start:299 stop:466 length:168 start_codon:yes stop_codon:yes gene_type:complete
MTVEELIKELQQIEDKTLDIRTDFIKNSWVAEVEVHHQGKGGYEQFGEVILITSE